MKALVVSLLVVAALATALAVAGYYDVAWLVGEAGTATLMLGFLAWVVLWDSRKRWPGETVRQRLVRIVFFNR